MKGQTRNIETYKVGAGAKMNEFDFHRHQGEMHGRNETEVEQTMNKPETRAERVTRLTRQAHEKVLRRKKRR